MFACHLITKIPPRLRHCAGMLQDWWSMFARLPHQPQQQTTMKRGGEAERHQACKETICVSKSVGTEKWYACGSAWAYSSVWEAEYYDSNHTILCLCDGSTHESLHTFFPQAVTRAAAGSWVTYPAPVSVHEFLCLRVCLSFCLISTSCFILGLIQTQHSCAVSQRKRAWGMGCQVLVSRAMLYNCDQQMEGKWGYQLGLIFSLWARLTPHTNTIAHPLIWQ